jgi:hypothetical protein
MKSSRKLQSNKLWQITDHVLLKLWQYSSQPHIRTKLPCHWHFIEQMSPLDMTTHISVLMNVKFPTLLQISRGSSVNSYPFKVHNLSFCTADITMMLIMHFFFKVMYYNVTLNI